MNLFARSCQIKEPLLRWPAVTLMCLSDMLAYLVGAWKHQRLSDPAFWSFTWAAYCAAMRGEFVL